VGARLNAFQTFLRLEDLKPGISVENRLHPQPHSTVLHLYITANRLKRLDITRNTAEFTAFHAFVSQKAETNTDFAQIYKS
jgi:hypothetical protein